MTFKAFPMQIKDLIHCLYKDYKAPQNVLFRVDAGRVMGLSFGHLFRCHILSEALKKYLHAKTNFFMKNHEDGIRQARLLGEHVVVVSNDQSFCVPDEADSIIFDVPGGPQLRDLKLAEEEKLWTIVIDDIGISIPWANVVLNSNVLAEPSRYPSNASLLIGMQYLILDERFESAKRKPKREKTPLVVLITFGGSDPTGLTAKVVNVLCRKKYEGIVFKIILGPGFTEGRKINALVKKSINEIDVFRNPPDMLPFYLNCDLAVCAGGRTLYELSAINIPIISIASIEHEAKVIQAFNNLKKLEGACLTWIEHEFVTIFEDTLSRLRRDRKRGVCSE